MEVFRKFTLGPFTVLLGIAIFVTAPVIAQQKVRARDLGVPFEGTPGRFNSITDVAGIRVAHTTLIDRKSVV